MLLQELFSVYDAEKDIILPGRHSFNIAAVFQFARREPVNHHEREKQTVPVTCVPDGKTSLHQLLAESACRVALPGMNLSVVR